MSQRLVAWGWAIGAGAAMGCAGAAHAELMFGVTAGGFLINWDTGTPGAIGSGRVITGLEPGETVVGLDYRPATGQLYALGSGNRLYTLDPGTGGAVSVGAGLTNPPLNGSLFGFDFHPVGDRARLVSNAEQNLRLDPNTGGVVFEDQPLAYGSGDPNFGQNPNVVHTAYTNSFGGATSTQLYGIDTHLDILVLHNPPKDGTLTTVGSLGVLVGGLGGFDISGATGIAYAVMRESSKSISSLFTINLTTGAATFVGEIDGGEVITAMTVVPAPAGATLLAMAGALAGRRRR